MVAAVLAGFAVVSLGLGFGAVPGVAGDPAGAQTPTTIDPLTACAAIQPTIVFVGTATDRAREVVTFTIEEIRSGDGSAGTEIEIAYPTQYNAAELELQSSYLVTAAIVDGDLHSVVQTADITACGQSTKYADGSRIDTGVLVGVKQQGPRLAALIAAGVAAALVVLVLLGRFFDRRSRYREQIGRA